MGDWDGATFTAEVIQVMPPLGSAVTIDLTGAQQLRAGGTLTVDLFGFVVLAGTVEIEITALSNVSYDAVQ